MDSVLTKPYLLYAEDDLDDYESLKDALDQTTDKYSISNAKNGSEVISFLESSDTLPCLIVLDLNMPIMDGKQVLEWLKNHHRFKNIPVLVFTTSSREEDIRLCQSHQCTFFRKPTLYRDLLHIVQTMLQICEENDVRLD